MGLPLGGGFGLGVVDVGVAVSDGLAETPTTLDLAAEGDGVPEGELSFLTKWVIAI
jgi:hypothetical protein